jgi:hypothetical protein
MSPFSQLSLKVIFHDFLDQTDPNTQQLVNPPFVYSLRIHPSGDWVAAGLGDGSVDVIKLSSKTKKISRSRLSDAHGTLVNSL